MSGTGYFKADESDSLYGGARQIIAEEKDHLKNWRGRAPCAGIALSGGGIRSASFCLGALQALAYEEWLPQFDYMSTVSGGGYMGSSLSYLLHYSRSAAGAPQYNVSKDCFPYLSYPMAGRDTLKIDEANKRKGMLLRRLRQNAKYLTPGNGITLLSLIGVVVRNTVASVSVHLALAVLVLMLLINYNVFGLDDQLVPLAWNDNRVLIAAIVLFLMYGLLSALYVPLTGLFDPLTTSKGKAAYWLRRRYEQLVRLLLFVGIVLLIASLIPWTHDYIRAQIALYVSAGSSVLGIVSSVYGYLQTSMTKKPKIPTSIVVAVASVLLLFGVLLLAYHTAYALYLRDGSLLSCAAILLAFLLLVGWLPNVNYLSVHRYYRDRLMETFMPDGKAMDSSGAQSGPTWTGNRTMMGDLCGLDQGPEPKSDSSSGADANGDEEAEIAREARIVEEVRIVGEVGVEGQIEIEEEVNIFEEVEEDEDVKKTREARKQQDAMLARGPYHIINANAVLVSSSNPRFRGRGGDNFIFSPLFTGSNATGWKYTDPDPHRGVTLATAMAISGAAVNPDTGCGGEGITRQPVLSVLMSLLNIRLGYWLNNPNAAGSQGRTKATRSWLWSSIRSILRKPNMLYPGMVETLGRGNLREDKRYVLLSDGGHFENLGLYELVRRRLRLIVVCDGAADPKYGFGDLANVIERVRADFGARIEISSKDLEPLIPRRRDSYPKDDAILPVAERGYLCAPIKYASPTPGGAPVAGANEDGLLIYLTTTFFKTLRADLYGYRQAHREFPDESTRDQFFDEKQFESYRELGFRVALEMMVAMSEEFDAGTDVDLNGVRFRKVDKASIA